MEIRSETQGDRAILRLKGKLDMMAVPHLRETILEKVNAGIRKLIIDLRDTTFVDSSGYGVLIETAQMLKEKGGLFRLLGAQSRARLLLNENVTFCETESDALSF